MKILPAGLEVEAGRGELLADVLSRAIVFSLPCGGAGYCGGCVVRLVEGELSEPSKEEELTGVLAKGFRLACRARVLGDVVVEVPRAAPVATVSGIMPVLEPDPLIRPLDERDEALPRALPNPSFSYEGLAFRSRGRWLGLAVDLGTTNISGALLDLKRGIAIVEGFVRNPQVSKGADIIARMYRALNGEADELRNLALRGVEELAEKLSKAAEISPEEVSALCIVGNSVMHALLLGLNLESLSRSPFEPPARYWIVGPASDLGFDLLSEAWTLIPPPIAGFVGSDALADLLVLQLLEIERPALLIDLGTNSEVMLLTGREVLAASAPAGSAFESNVLSGIGGIRGAVRRVRLTDSGIKLDVEGKPLGLAGSGLISAIAEMLRKGLLSPSGKLSKELGGRLVLVEKPRKIEVTQRDVREIQKAVAAVYSAWKVLMEKAGISPSDLMGVYLAGTFGSNLDPDDALEIGLIPSVDSSKIVSLGNTALSGAKSILISRKAKELAEKLPSMVRHVDLAREPNFTEIFIEGTFLSKRK